MTERATTELTIRFVGVMGFGLMGSDVGQVCARFVYRMVVSEVDEAALTQGLSRSKGVLADGVQRNKISPADKDRYS